MINKMDDYKGIYYGDSIEPKYYEGGAHFKFIELYRILDFLEKKQKMIYDCEKSPIHVIFYLFYYFFLE